MESELGDASKPWQTFQNGTVRYLGLAIAQKGSDVEANFSEIFERFKPTPGLCTVDVTRSIGPSLFSEWSVSVIRASCLRSVTVLGPRQTVQNAVSDQGIYCLLVEISTSSK